MMRRSVLRSLDDNASLQDQAALVSGMLAGSQRAWREFHARYDRLILTCIHRVTARHAARMAADEIREIYATLLVQLCANDMGKLRSFDASRGKRLGSWVGLLAANCAYDHLRTLRGEPGRASLDEIADDAPVDEPTPDEVVERKERLALAAELLGELSDKDRELFTLFYDEGLEPEQIAERMQISVKTVYSKKHKIQSRLQAHLSEPRHAAPLAA